MENLFLEYRSLYKFDETVEKLTEKILSSGWKNPATHDLQATLAKSEIEVLPVKVIELCNPKIAANILTDSHTRLYSSMLPCRISVYEKADGNTYLSLMNAVEIANQIGGSAADTMILAFDESIKFIHEVAVK
ncbi:MAG: DUF302 domain-containing protein [Paludibacter sp.]